MNSSQHIKTYTSFVRQSASHGSSLPFILVLFYLFLEFGRPQHIMPGLNVLHLPAVTVVLLALLLVLTRKLRLSDKQTLLFLLLLGLMAFHVPLASNNYFAYIAFKGMLLTFAAYLALISFVDSFQRFRTLINVWLGIHVFLAVMGILNGGRGVGGFLLDENDLCMTLNMIIPFAFFMMLEERNNVKKLTYASIMILFLLANIFTMSRGGFVGLVAVGLYCWLFSPRKKMAAVLLTLSVIVMINFAPDKYWDEIRSIKQDGVSYDMNGERDYKGTGGERIYQWEIGWKMFLDNPILGVGQKNFPWRFREYEIASGHEEGLHGRSRAGRAAHSLYFTLIPEFGVVGIIIFLGMLYYSYRDNKSLRKLNVSNDAESAEISRKLMHLSRAIEGSLYGYLVSGIFISVLYYPNFWYLMGFVVVMKRIASDYVITAHSELARKTSLG